MNQEAKLREIVLPNKGRRKAKNLFDNTYVAYTLTFVYSKYDGNFLIKGYANDVKDYLKENYTHYFYNMVLYDEGKGRSIWKFWNRNWYLRESVLRKESSFLFGTQKVIYRTPFVLYKIGGEKEYTFKRMPKRWIPLFDKCK